MHKDNSTMSPNPNYLSPEEGELLTSCVNLQYVQRVCQKTPAFSDVLHLFAIF